MKKLNWILGTLTYCFFIWFTPTILLTFSSMFKRLGEFSFKLFKWWAFVLDNHFYLAILGILISGIYIQFYKPLFVDK